MYFEDNYSIIKRQSFTKKKKKSSINGYNKRSNTHLSKLKNSPI